MWKNKGFLSSLLEGGKALDNRGGFHDGVKGPGGHGSYELLPILLHRKSPLLCNDGGPGA